ncbi:MAG: metallophosphoesterase family protein [Candidatus Aenigmarchaeota archaeon]|nr:metallophosphoesterase family protein [Candidatus Aenigmarchaeota archaeon]
MPDKSLLEEVGKILQNESKLIQLPSYGRGIFVGDTHGDLNASEKVIHGYFDKDTIVVFLGDYVDRGQKSRENMDYLLEKKLENPKNLFLLTGNHDGYKILKWYPQNFWRFLSEEERNSYANVLAELPLAVSGNGIIALHGGLPDVNLEKIKEIEPGSEQWLRITGGDLKDIERGYMEISDSGRPEFGRKYFERVMKKLGKNVLIRSHQPGARGIMYDNRCLTLFTSHEYFPKRTIAIADLGKEVKTVDDIDILEI